MTAEQGINYLKHRTYVENDKQVWPVFREKYARCKCIHLDFSENINITPKFEVQDAHFSGKQHSLHCMLLEPANPYKFVFHLSNNTTHDSAFVDLVLNDIFDLQNVWNETVLIKSDNCQEQYKCLYAFSSYQQLANKYNSIIIRVYGAAGHGRGLIDAMSSFGVKGILRRSIIGKDIFFADSNEIKEYLEYLELGMKECCIE